MALRFSRSSKRSWNPLNLRSLCDPVKWLNMSTRGCHQKSFASFTGIEDVTEPNDDDADIVSPIQSKLRIKHDLTYPRSSTSVEEAQPFVDQLLEHVMRVLKGNQDISKRMANIENRAIEYFPSTAPNVLGADENASPTEGCADPNQDSESCLTVKQNRDILRSEPSDEPKAVVASSFEVDLRTVWALQASHGEAITIFT
jgi:hypothetical protein